MRVLIFSFILFVAASCGNSNSEKPKTTKKIDVPSQRYDLYAINAVMSLPDYFKQVDFKEYKKIFSGMTSDAQVKARGLQRLEYLENNYPAYNIFIDETNYKNTVVLFPLSDNIPINQDVGSVLVRQVERDFADLFKYGNFEYKRMQAKKSSFGNSQYIKLKYLITNKKTEYYTTCYLFTSDRSTFMIWVELQEDDDFEAFIESLVIGR